MRVKARFRQNPANHHLESMSHTSRRCLEGCRWNWKFEHKATGTKMLVPGLTTNNPRRVYLHRVSHRSIGVPFSPRTDPTESQCSLRLSSRLSYPSSLRLISSSTHSKTYSGWLFALLATFPAALSSQPFVDLLASSCAVSRGHLRGGGST